MEHLSLDALADLLAAEGSTDDETHLSSCAGCAGRLEELAAAEVEVAAVLASLPAPALPAGLADRLQAAVDAEPPLVEGDVPATSAAVSTGGSGRAAASGGATITPLPSTRAARRRSWGPLSGAAAVLVVASGAVFGLSQLGGGGSDDSTTSAATDTAGGSGSESDEGAGLVRNETGTDYAADGALAAAVPSLLSGSSTSMSAPADAQEQSQLRATPELDRLRAPDGLASCLTTLLPAEEPDLRPLAVDYAAYAGQPAVAVLLPATGGAAKVDVFVVGAGCAADDAQLLYFTQVDRP